jgi:hypothetical protein
VLAAKTELKTIASKIIQHPAVTIERIKLRRRVIEFLSKPRWAGPPPALGKRRPLIARSGWCGRGDTAQLRGRYNRDRGRQSKSRIKLDVRAAG